MKRRLDVTALGADHRRIATFLSGCVLGQDDAVRVTAEAWQRYKKGLNAPGRPLANIMFLGPTGTGKTRIVEAVAEFAHGSRAALTKVDCAEFQHSHEIAKLIGSPPGYLGHRETPPALSRTRIEERSGGTTGPHIVLFDEIEKSHDTLWHLLLGILDKAELTLGDNKRVSFSDVFVFMTGNLGARDMQKAARPPGFTPAVMSVSQGKLASVATEAARRKFTPEFMNRLDHVTVFNPLSADVIRGVVENEIREVEQRFRRAMAVRIRLTQSALSALVAEGTDADYGARYLKRTVESRIVGPMTNLLASHQLQPGDRVCIGRRDGEYAFTLDEQAEAATNAA